MKSHKQCDHCGKWFHGNNSQRNYHRHLLKHQPKKEKSSYNCQECPKSFPFKSYLNRHVKRAHFIEKIDLEFKDNLRPVETETLTSLEDKSKKSRRKQTIESRI